MNGIILAANASFVLHNDRAALDLARQVVRRRLSLDESSHQAGADVSARARLPEPASGPVRF